MSKKDLMQQHSETFASIRHFDENSNEYWLARQLSRVLEYSEFRHFLPVIEKAKEACTTSKHAATDHFEDILEMVDIKSRGGGRCRMGDKITVVVGAVR